MVRRCVTGKFVRYLSDSFIVEFEAAAVKKSYWSTSPQDSFNFLLLRLDCSCFALDRAFRPTDRAIGHYWQALPPIVDSRPPIHSSTNTCSILSKSTRRLPVAPC